MIRSQRPARLPVWVHCFLSLSSSHLTSSPLLPRPLQKADPPAPSWCLTTSVYAVNAVSVLELAGNQSCSHLQTPLPFPSFLSYVLTPPSGCKVSILDRAQASAQHHALSEQAQRPVGTLFISISQLQFLHTVCICQASPQTHLWP